MCLDSDELARLLAETAGSLVFSDCEGAELELFQPSVVEAGCATTFVIECHDFVSPGATQTLVGRLLVGRLLGSHEVEVVPEGPRDPNAIACLRGLRSLDRWIAVSEGRPLTMHWLYARPKQASDEAVPSDG